MKTVKKVVEDIPITPGHYYSTGVVMTPDTVFLKGWLSVREDNTISTRADVSWCFVGVHLYPSLFYYYYKSNRVDAHEHSNIF